VNGIVTASLVLIGFAAAAALVAVPAVGWLVWRGRRDSLPVYRAGPPPVQHVRAEITVIRTALKDGVRQPPG